MSKLDQALELTKHGFAVFPCHSVRPDGVCTCGVKNCQHIGKHPWTADGHKSATVDPDEVRRLFRGQRSVANIGIATGPPSGVFALDVDGSAGAAVLAQLEQQHGALPQTATSLTGRDDGKHIWFRYPQDAEVRSKNKIVVPGLGRVDLDQKASGGYVIGPGSNHASGRTYRWEHDPETAPIQSAPGWLLDLVAEPSTNGNGRATPQIAKSTTRTGAERANLAGLFSGGVEDLRAAAGGVEDLRAAPGAPSGQRHDTALQLIGSAIGRGIGLIEIQAAAVEWANRCDPPMDEREVLRIVADLEQRQRQQPGGWDQGLSSHSSLCSQAQSFTGRIESEAAVLDQPLPEPAPWPELDSDAYYGLAGEIVRRIEPETESDPVAIMAQLLVGFGNMIGRGPHFAVESTSHHANLFAVLVGNTARGRKGTSGDRVKSILQEVDPEWVSRNINFGLVSGEGLIWNVRDPIYKLEQIKEKNRIVGTEMVLADAGIEDKRLMVLESEFASVLRVCKRETSTLSAVLRLAWDSGSLKTLAKNSPAVATDAHVSIASHITQDELTKTLAAVDGFNGFANRFLWFAVRRSKLLPGGGRDLDLSDLTQRLAVTAEQALAVERMYRDQAATALWRRIYADLADDPARGLLGAVTSRAEAQVLRLSMIYALLDGSGTITENHLRAALAVWRYCRASAVLIFGGLAADPVEDQILAAIRQQPGISRRDLHRALGNHVKAAVLRTVLVRLRDDGKIRDEKIDTGGRPAESWYPCEQSEQSELSHRSGSDRGLSSHSSLCSQQQGEPDQQTPETEEFVL